VNRIFYTKPSITELEVKYAIATSSCTGALHMSIEPGDMPIIADTKLVLT